MADTAFEQNLKKYANLLVRVGVNITEGDLLYFRTSVTDDPTIRRLAQYIVEMAYKAGAKYVDVDWRDEMTTKLRLLHSTEDNLDFVADWRVKAIEGYADAEVSRLVVMGDDPALFADVDPNRIQRMMRAGQKALAHVRSKLIDENIWSGAAVPVQAWADKVFPDASEEARLEKLWDAIFSVTRVYEDDPVAAWEAHRENLLKRANYMSDKQYTTLHFKGDGTDLKVGLPQGHIWLGGGDVHKSGKIFMPNIPTEEIFTMPHRMNVNGTVKASKPLSYMGHIVDDFSFKFEDGRVSDYEAKQGQAVLQNLLDTDDGAKHLGEVALVPHSSPISQKGFLFFDTLFDENAACHVALGRAYQTTMQNGTDMEEDEFVERGGNVSDTHVDFMIGNETIDIDAVTPDGSREPIMRQGEWAFEV